MSISSIGVPSVLTLGPSGVHGHRRGQDVAASGSPPDELTPAMESIPVEEPVAPETASAQGETPAAGVLRLLEEGHYKGVADVRLRINFHEELTAMQDAATRQAATGALDDLSSTVGAALESIAGGEALSTDQQQTIASLRESFGQSVADAREVYTAGQPADGAALRSAVQEAFDALVGGLQGVLAPADPQPPIPPADASATVPAEPTDSPVPTESAVPAEPVAASETPPDAASAPPSPLEELQTAFAAALQALDAGLEPVSLLPDLSPPSGHGRAYEKFLAINNGLQTPSPQPIDTPVDVQV